MRKRLPRETPREASLDHAQKHRRQQAIARYLAGDKIAVICRDLHCAKSWLYQRKARSQADHPAWATGRSTRPQRTPSQTPRPVVERILTLSRTVEHQEHQGQAAAIQQALQQQGIEPIPSRRTI
jgi:MarR-like DNA-binding transcriptional regulator SgrR of sgrS sRNA